MEKFSSASDFDTYLQAVVAQAPKSSPIYKNFEMGTANSASETSITNNQESGVDEGDIVKAHGDHLVILRRGRLFSVELGSEELTPTAYSDAFPQGSKLGTWYDEMLIHGDTIVVVGFSYRVSSTEIALFKIDDQGVITHQDTFFLRSNDYYSSRNYASRLVDGKLVFYMPYFLLRSTWGVGGSGYEASLPQIHPWPMPEVPEESDGWLNIIDKSTIYRPIQNVSMPALHTVVTCDLDKAKFSCTAEGIVGPHSRNFYVAKDAVYLWVSKASYSFFPIYFGDNEGEQPEAQQSEAVVYRLPLDGQAPGAVRAAGTPTDQFSFKADDQQLSVVLRGNGGDDWMWGPEMSDGDVHLVQIPLSDFSSMVDPVSVDQYIPLNNPGKGYMFQNRFVGDHLLYGTGSGWWDGEGESRLYVYNVAKGGEVRELALAHSVDRLEVMGDAAVVVGGAGQDLHISAIELTAYPRVADTHIEKDAVQGETRSHGFFYKQYGDQGILGLPVREQGAGYNQLFRGSARIVFVGVDSNTFVPLGSLESTQGGVDDKCEVSCVDWYGNARPIFFQDRIFGLMGYELVEGNLNLWDRTISEQSRVDFSSILGE